MTDENIMFHLRTLAASGDEQAAKLMQGLAICGAKMLRLWSDPDPFFSNTNSATLTTEVTHVGQRITGEHYNLPDDVRLLCMEMRDYGWVHFDNDPSLNRYALHWHATIDGLML